MIYNECIEEEILAYKELENEIFDFGEGPMKMENSEILYYNNDLQAYQDFKKDKQRKICTSFINPLYNPNINKIRRKRNLYYKCKEKRRLSELRELSWYAVGDKETHLFRIYRGSRSKVLKKISNKTVRKAKNLLKGSDYKKVYNFWHELW